MGEDKQKRAESIEIISEEIDKLQGPANKPIIEKLVVDGSNQDEKVAMLLTAVNTLITRSNETNAPKLTPPTKQFISGGIFIVAILVAFGWGWGDIEAKDALVVISSCITGGFALLRL